MKKVGITGQNGFIGSHLFNRLSLLKDEFELITFQKEYFEDMVKLVEWVKKCDVIIHLAALNRHNEPATIFNTNINLVQKIIKAIDIAETKPHVIFSSSTQEGNEKKNTYGNSKYIGRYLLKDWASKNNILLSGLIIPNVFGPFGKPYGNSVIATFCHQLCNNEEPKIIIDGKIRFIYIDELVNVILSIINNNISNYKLLINHTSEYFVSEILNILFCFKNQYLEKGILPKFINDFQINLFNTFRCYINYSKHFPVYLKTNMDERGIFVETIKLGIGGQVSFSTTVSGVTRGNHFHTRKIERFTVIKGKALIQIRKFNTNETFDFYLDGENPSYVDIPVWYAHNIKNVGREELYTIFWINEFYNENDADTYFENV
jgi:UDP-2-acetamido-2,6-beta-L-arabino-hexul-4-ose reductase